MVVDRGGGLVAELVKKRLLGFMGQILQQDLG